MLFEKMNDVSGVLFSTMFDGQMLFESCDFRNQNKVTGTSIERIFAY